MREARRWEEIFPIFHPEFKRKSWEWSLSSAGSFGKTNLQLISLDFTIPCLTRKQFKNQTVITRNGTMLHVNMETILYDLNWVNELPPVLFLDEKIYMDQPEGFVEPGQESKYPAVLEGYSDADWNTLSGIILILGGGAICWKSKKPTIIANSTMEAELTALAIWPPAAVPPPPPTLVATPPHHHHSMPMESPNRLSNDEVKNYHVVRMVSSTNPDVPKASPEITSEVYSKLAHFQKNVDWDAAVQLVVKAIDPCAQSLPANDWYRLHRSLEIIQASL
ncbi:hypothetical protein HYC85_014519 [Camellia sinensis]|uniref:Uncharacterized protein n=1 Tax=Camellia sinensis TaxID=4442 RepID=A0A7J7H6E8_CAMSI|nr:hypothetical protein HYC85_014519 [Camellia sinensis]